MIINLLILGLCISGLVCCLFTFRNLLRYWKDRWDTQENWSVGYMPLDNKDLRSRFTELAKERLSLVSVFGVIIGCGIGAVLSFNWLLQ